MLFSSDAASKYGQLHDEKEHKWGYRTFDIGNRRKQIQNLKTSLNQPFERTFRMVIHWRIAWEVVRSCYLSSLDSLFRRSRSSLYSDYFKIIGRPIHESNGTLSPVRHYHRLKSSNAGIHSFVLQL